MKRRMRMTTAPPTNTARRPTRIIMPTRSKAWKRLIQANNLMQMPRAHAIFDAKRVTRSVKHAISDLGATGHFLVEDTPVVNKKVAANPISITLPNEKKQLNPPTHVTLTYHGCHT